MKSFIQRFGEKITGTLSGFDRLVLRGTLRQIAYPRGMMGFLWHKQVRLKEFGKYVYGVCQKLREASCRRANEQGRPIIYLRSSKIDKAAVAEKIAQRDGIEKGLIAVISCLEPCIGYDVVANRQTKQIDLVQRQRKCLFLYHYFIDSRFGFMNARIQSWFPFNIQICMNGREWLSRQMDRLGMRYIRRGNCFAWIEDVEQAQRLMKQHLKMNWKKELDRIARMVHPFHAQIFKDFPIQYYWSTFESEWASDLMFKNASDLAFIYPRLILQGITTFSSPDVMRFLGKRFQPNSDLEMTSDFKRRPEGVRIKHRAGKNTVKLYDKQGSVLRVETTVNEPREFKVFRAKENDPNKVKRWRPVRRGIADLYRVAEISQATNERYLDALASVDVATPLGDILKRISQPINWKRTKVRALRPNSPDDLLLLRAIGRGEFTLTGFRNRNLQELLYDRPAVSPKEKRSRSSRVTRLIRILRAHHLIAKVSSTYRYQLTAFGRQVVSAILAAERITIEQLTKAVA